MSVDPSLWTMGVRCMEGEWVHLTLGSDVVFVLQAVRNNNPHGTVYLSLYFLCVSVYEGFKLTTPNALTFHSKSLSITDKALYRLTPAYLPPSFLHGHFLLAPLP